MYQPIGEKRVRLEFNPSGNTDVDTIKKGTAAMINFCEGLKDKDPRLAALAQTAYEEACFWAVKAATTVPDHRLPSVHGTSKVEKDS